MTDNSWLVIGKELYLGSQLMATAAGEAEADLIAGKLNQAEDVKAALTWFLGLKGQAKFV